MSCWQLRPTPSSETINIFRLMDFDLAELLLGRMRMRDLPKMAVM